MYIIGQGLWGKLKFVDNTMPEYKRPYLVVAVNSNSKMLTVLNVSSVRGKEPKLLFPYNLELKKYNPPFIERSFVKLDSAVEITFKQAGECKLLCGGKILDSSELKTILTAYIQ